MTEKRKLSLFKLCEQLKINFNDIELLNIALCHSSYVNENSDMNQSYERFEFLGDSILNIMISLYLFNTNPLWEEGMLSKERAGYTSAKTLASLSLGYSLQDYILFGRGDEILGSKKSVDILADVFEAILAAYYIDSGFKMAQAFLYKAYDDFFLNPSKIAKDYKSLLQVNLHKYFKIFPKYIPLKEEGLEHDKLFFVQLQIGERVFGPSSGKRKKDAENEVAKLAYYSLFPKKEPIKK